MVLYSIDSDIYVNFGFDIMTLGVAVCLLIVSLTTSLPQKKEKDNNKNGSDDSGDGTYTADYEEVDK